MAGPHLLARRYYPGSECTSEARVLFEVYACDGCNAAHIAKALNVDKSSEQDDQNA